jgi:monofunctional glycosyltransferase
MLVAFSVFQVALLPVVAPPCTPLMIYRYVMGEGMDFRWRSLSEISPHLQQAVIASENQKFPSHHGFDWEEMKRALEELQMRRRQRGASTITMQTARNLFLWQGLTG